MKRHWHSSWSLLRGLGKWVQSHRQRCLWRECGRSAQCLIDEICHGDKMDLWRLLLRHKMSTGHLVNKRMLQWRMWNEGAHVGVTVERSQRNARVAKGDPFGIMSSRKGEVMPKRTSSPKKRKSRRLQKNKGNSMICLGDSKESQWRKRSSWRGNAFAKGSHRMSHVTLMIAEEWDHVGERSMVSHRHTILIGPPLTTWGACLAYARPIRRSQKNDSLVPLTD